MPHSIDVRLAELSDAPAIARLCAELGYPTAAEHMQPRLEQILARPDDAVFIAVAGPDLVGWVHVLRVLYLEADPFAEIGGLVVSEACRGQGAGRRLMGLAEEWAAGRGLATVRLRSNVVREGAHVFYRRLGYEIEKSQYTFVKAVGEGTSSRGA